MKVTQIFKGKTKVTFLVVIVLFLTSLQFLITPFLQNVFASVKNSEYQILITTTTMNDTAISMEQFIETEVIDKSRCGGNASTVNLPDGWCLNNESIPFFIGHEQSQNRSSFIRHYNHKGYERCLANKTLVLIGDSRVRYQFMYLASYLQSKRHMKCKDAFPSIEQEDGECEMLMTHSWKEWYRWTTSKLSNSLEQNALCDCFRKQEMGYRHLIAEYRFLKRSTSYGEINMVYLQSFKDLVQMSSEFPPFASFFPSSEGSYRCKPGECSPENRTVVFKGNLNDTMWNILPLLNTTHAFVNHGWAGMKNHPPSKMPQFSCKMNEFTKDYPNIKMGFITHVPERGYTRNKSIPAITERMDCEIEVFDRYPTAENVPTTWYYDRHHVRSILNKEYNHQLVESLCPLPNVD